ncbi:putative bifunctional diguanylate cyclase/phosphodiesterase [Kineococcus glutinatus]|uniref:Diguanylate cyclase (GGDEF)-like protein n=1 Tax=Kineococcus glutinatus TaxID=1070872 RepID=A0ABP9I4Z4_9ACTN
MLEAPASGRSPLVEGPLTSRMMALLFLGSALLHLVANLPAFPRGQTPMWPVVITLYLTVGAWLLRSSHRLRRRGTMPLLVLVDIALVTALLASQPDRPLLAMLYLWDVPIVFTLFRARLVVALTALQFGCGAAVLLPGAAGRTGSWPLALLNLTIVYGCTLVVVGTLTRIVARALEEARRERAQEAALAQHRAFHDPLTGLPNRVLYLDRLQLAVAHAARTGTDVAVLLVDLDDFKVVNDSLGHATGDRLLVATVERLTSCLREGDTLARLGGDEFVVVAEGLHHPEDALAVASHLQEGLARPVDVGEQRFFVSASIGVTCVAGRALPPDEVLREADAAMYRAKRRGGGTVETYDESLREAVLRHLELERALRTGLDAGEGLGVAYQPIVDPATGACRGVEALARWASPGLGPVGPDEFIPVAERSALILRLGEEVLARSYAAANRWRQLVPDFTVAVNVSPRQLQQPDFATRLADLARRSGAPVAAVHLEVTEGLVLQEDEAVEDNLNRLRALGVRLSLDDFGTGWSSLARLRTLALDRLKVDRSFIGDEVVLRACVELGRALGIDVVAEGVEEPAQAQVLQRLGYPLAQGYLFGRPVPEEEVTLLLLARQRV